MMFRPATTRNAMWFRQARRKKADPEDRTCNTPESKSKSLANLTFLHNMPHCVHLESVVYHL
ncbi:protein of unknown function [Desulfovibrio sp. 86]|nr:protein of unknown function [Desulfovibrio sp. 86]